MTVKFSHLHVSLLEKCESYVKVPCIYITGVRSCLVLSILVEQQIFAVCAPPSAPIAIHS